MLRLFNPTAIETQRHVVTIVVMLLELVILGSKEEEETVQEIRKIVARNRQGKREKHDTQDSR